MNIAATLNNFLLSNVVTIVDAIYNDVFPYANGDAIISRYDPSSAREVEYIDGSAEGNVSIAYYMRSNDAALCRNTLLSIVDKLDNLKINDGTIELNVEAVNLPAFVSIDDKEQVIYTVSIAVRYMRKEN